MKTKAFLKPGLLVALVAAFTCTTAARAATYTWANSNVAGTPAATLNWLNATQGTWTGGTPVSNNANTIQFFQDASTALTNNGSTGNTQTSNIDNGGAAFELGTLTLSGRASATTGANLTMTISGNALNFSAATGTINLNGINNTRVLTYNLNSAIQLGTLSSASALTITGAGTGTFNIGGNISELQAGGGSIVKSGTSTVTLSGTNTYTGNTTLSGGTLSVGVAANLGAAGANLVFNGGTLQITGTTLTNFSGIGHTVSFTSGQTVGLDINNAANTFTADQNLNQGTGGLTKSGAGTLTLNGTNTYTGNTTLSAGALNINSATAIGSGTLVIGASGTSIDNTSGSPVILSNNNNINMLLGNMVYNGSGGSSLSFGNGVLTMNAASRTLTVTNGTMTIGSIAAGDGTYVFNAAGAGTLVINNAADASFTGGFSAGGGVTVKVGDKAALGNGTFTATNVYLQAFQPLNGAMTMSNTVLPNQFTVSGNNSIELAGIVTGGTAGNRTITSSITGGTLTLNNVDINTEVGTVRGMTIAGTGNTTIKGTIANGAGTTTANTFTVTNTATTTLSGTNTYTGNTTVSAGTLIAAKQASLYNSTNASWTPTKITVASGATLALGVGDSASGYFDAAAVDTFRDGTHMGNSTTTTGFKSSAILGFDTTNAGGSFTYNSNITNFGTSLTNGVAKLGTGTLVLGGTNTYTGNTTVSAGTLLINTPATAGNSGTGSGSVSAAAGTLGGTGILRPGSTNAITVNSGAFLAPGDSTTGNGIGTLVLDSGGTTATHLLTMNSGAKMSFQLGSGLTNDKLNFWNYAGSADLVLNSNEIDITMLAGSTTGLYHLFNFYSDSGSTAMASGISSGLSVNFLDGASGTLQYNTNSIDLNITAVPEPATWALLAFSLTTIVVLRRRRNAPLFPKIRLYSPCYFLERETGRNHSAEANLPQNNSMKTAASPLAFVAICAAFAITTATHGATYTWANSNVAGTPSPTLNWLNATQGTWTGGPPVSNNANTIQFFQDASTALTNNGSTGNTQTSIIDNGGSAFQLGTLTLNGKASATTGANLTMTISGDALNFSAATGTINLNGINNTRVLTYNLNSAIQLGTASSADALTITGNGTGTFNIGGNISELQSAGGSIVKSGTSTVTLSGTNTYKGSTTLSAGTLSVGVAANLGAAAANLVFNGGTLQITGTTLTNFSGIGHTVSFTSGQTVGLDINNAANTFTADQNLNQGTGGLTKSGAGTLTLNGTNTYTGNTTLSAGALNINSATAIGSGTLVIGASGTSIDNTSGSPVILSNNNNINMLLGNMVYNGSGGSSLSFGNGVLTMNAASRTLTVTNGTMTIGSIAAGDGTYVFNAAGAGTLVINNAADASFTGGFSAGGGVTVKVGDKAALGNGTFTATNVYLQAFQPLNGAMTMSNTVLPNQFTVSGNNSIELAGIVTGGTAGNRTITSSITGGTLTLNNVDINTEVGTVRGMTIAGTGNTTIKGTIANGAGTTTANTFTVTNTATTTLSGTNTYTGNTTVSAGTLIAAKQASLYNSTNASWTPTKITVASGATLALGVGDSASGYFDAAAVDTFRDGTHMGNSTTTTGFKSSAILGFDTTNAGGSFTYNSNITNFGTSLTNGVAKLGTGTLVLGGTNTYTGNTTVSAGTLIVAKQASLYNSTNASWTPTKITVASGATLALGVGDSASGYFDAAAVDTFRDGTHMGNSTTTTGFKSSAILGFDTTNAGGSFTYNSNITNLGTSLTNGVAKLGTGMLVFGGNNTYTGATTVSAGTLAASATGGNQSLGGTSGITVSTGGTLLLSQSNQINNSATMGLAGGTIKFGSAVSEGSSSAFGVGALTLTANSTLDFNSLAGTITFSSFTPGAFTLAITNWTNGSSHLIFNQDESGALSSFTLNGGTAFQTSLGGGFYEIGITAVPEPGTIAAGLALIGLVAWRERKRLASLLRANRHTETIM